MLPVQVSYWTLQETRRSNLAREKLQGELQEENRRHNIESEKLGWSTLSENTRHNKATEGIGYAQISLGYAQLGEATRHNVATEGLGYAQLGEASRHNVATEGIQGKQADASMLSAQTGWSRAQYQNAYDAARTNTETSLLPYRKWESVSKSVQGFSSGARNVADSAKGFVSLAGLLF